MDTFFRVFRTTILLISGLVELSVFVIMAFYPQVFFKVLSPEIIGLARSFAAGALAISILSFLLLYFRGKQVSMVGMSILAIYNAGIGLAQGFNHAGFTAVLFHILLVISLLFLTVKEAKNTLAGSA